MEIVDKTPPRCTFVVVSHMIVRNTAGKLSPEQPDIVMHRLSALSAFTVDKQFG